MECPLNELPVSPDTWEVQSVVANVRGLIKAIHVCLCNMVCALPHNSLPVVGVIDVKGYVRFFSSVFARL